MTVTLNFGNPDKRKIVTVTLTSDQKTEGLIYSESHIIIQGLRTLCPRVLKNLLKTNLSISHPVALYLTHKNEVVY